MFLKQLKLAGFKTFVEPTVIPLAHALIGIVGPNGCGKSNIVDAVRWVMGESSAKSLRGESMTDVIFNGSTTRKAQGQASVELLFDNSLGRLSGPYAQYQEISVKRTVDRHGDAAYYLNNTRCRRRDISDLFLGTGAGARGYAVISQGMIAHIIEARPEDLRLFLEEAAGVSKYKDRRKETLQRITGTRDNMSRIHDIRLELEQQLQFLSIQAEAARSYQSLQHTEKTAQIMILLITIRACEAEYQQAHQQHIQLQAQHTQNALALETLEKTRAHLEAQWQAAQTQCTHAQQAVFDITAERMQMEAVAEQTQREQARLTRSLEKSTQQCTEMSRALEQHKTLRRKNDAELEPLLHAHHAAETEKDRYYAEKTICIQHYETAAATHNHAQTHLQSSTHALAQAERDQLHHQNREAELHNTLTALQKARDLIQAEQTPDAAMLTEIQNTGLALQTQRDALSRDIASKQREKQETRQQLSTIQSTLATQQTLQKTLWQKITTLQAQIDARVKQQPPHTRPDYLPATDNPLINTFTIAKPWRIMAEFIINRMLAASVMDDTNTLLADLPAVPDYPFSIIQQKVHEAPDRAQAPRFIDLIAHAYPILPIALENIYLADTLEAARDFLSTSQPSASVITPDGYWLGHGFIFSIPHDDKKEQDSILTLQQSLHAYQTEYQQALLESTALETQRDTQEAALRRHDEIIETLHTAQQTVTRNIEEQERQASACHTKITAHATKTELFTAQIESAREKLPMVRQAQAEAQTRIHAAQAAVMQAKTTLETTEQSLQALKSRRILAEKHYENACHALQTQALTLQRLTLQKKQYTTEIERLERAYATEQKAQQSITHALHALQKEANITTRIEAMKIRQTDAEQTSAKLLSHAQSLQAQMTTSSTEYHIANKALTTLTRDISACASQIAILRDRIQQSETLLNQFPEPLITCCRNTTPETLAHYQESSKKAGAAIQALGAVNLTAVASFERESERKTELDGQYQDLQEALCILESAIATMDKETKGRLQSTFQAVNTQFKSIFPKLFGGGHAELSLTCDNLLEAGIVVMAQPPGKKNARIHLLSGGEKAMTAVALIFALFQLNPSPFCILDEVDAPLDDVNIGRFCELVKEMSEVVQFLFITHNKVTMTLADQLVGVTMREAGVSRVVAVDVNEAIEQL